MATFHFRRIERRRTARVAMLFDLVVQGHSYGEVEFKINTRTESVSRHGGAMILDLPVTVGQQLVLTNVQTSECTECKVVAIRSAKDKHLHVSFEFTGKNLNFWKMAFPAAGARPSRRVAPVTAIA